MSERERERETIQKQAIMPQHPTEGKQKTNRNNQDANLNIPEASRHITTADRRVNKKTDKTIQKQT